MARGIVHLRKPCKAQLLAAPRLDIPGPFALTWAVAKWLRAHVG